MRARFVPPQRAALGCEARAWENETRLHARNMNASFDRIDSRGKDVEPTANLVGSFSKRLQHGGVPLSPKNFGSLLRETFSTVECSTDAHLSFFTLHAEHTHRLVSMPPVKPPSYTNLSSEKS